MARVLFAVLAAALIATVTRADDPAPVFDWPQWRGPNRDGNAPFAVLPGVLPGSWGTEPPPPNWTKAVGRGCSGPAIAGGYVFIMGREKDTEYVLCLYGDGKERWKVAYPESYVAPDPTVPHGPNATPTVDRDRVYAFGQGGMLHCIEIATGKVLWKHDCRSEYWGVAKTPLGDDAWFPACGAAASPLVDGDTVIVAVGGKKAGTFTAFDRATGKIRWKALEDRSSYASPLIASPGGVKQLIGFTGTRMVGLRHGDRALLWDFPFKARYEQTIISPVVWKDLVIVSGEARATVALKLTRDGDGVKQSVAWTNDDLKAYLTTPVVFGDHLVGYDGRTNRLVCVALATGETAWASERVPGKYHSIVHSSGKLLVMNSEGELYVFEVTPKDCARVAKLKLCDKGVWAHLAVAGNQLYVKDRDKLYRYWLAGL